jgi:tetratricopeptide (TPR) repeat protein
MSFVRTRWLLAVLSLAASIWLMKAAFKIQGMGAAGPVILSMVAFVSTVLLIAPETAFWLAEQIARPFANLFYPSDSFKKPPVSYLLARRYRSERRFEDAVAQYENIIHFHPLEQDAYAELIEVARQTGDEELAAKYAALMRRRFPELDERHPDREEAPQATSLSSETETQGSPTGSE